MADINNLKDKIKSTIYPNGTGAINASDHQAMLLDMADGMAETDTELAKLSEETNGILATINLNSLIVKGEYYNPNGTIGFADTYQRVKMIKVMSSNLILKGFDSLPDGVGVSVRCFDKDKKVVETKAFYNTTKEITLSYSIDYIGIYAPSSIVFPSNCSIVFTGGYFEQFENQIASLNETCEVLYSELANSLAVTNLSAMTIFGEYYQPNGAISPIDTYNRLPLIKVDAESIYVFNAANSGASIRCLATNKVVVGTIELNKDSADYLFDLPSGTRYLGVYYKTSVVIPTDAAIVMGESWLAQVKQDIDNAHAKIAELLETQSLADKFIILPSFNLFNQNSEGNEVGYYIRNNIKYASASYNTSEFIAVQPNKTYYAAKEPNRAGFRFVNYYDANKNYLGGYFEDVLIYEFTTPTSCAFVRITVYAKDYQFTQVAESLAYYTSYEVSLGLPISTSTDPKRIATLYDINNVLYGKKWAVVGDSFSAAFANPQVDWLIEDGKYKGQSKVYGYLIGNRNNMELQWLSKGGKTMATPASGDFTNAFSLNEYKNIDADVDYITIYLGINDSHHAPGSTGDDGEDMTGEIPLGTINDTTNATFYGAWNVVMPYLIAKHPFAHIGIIVSNGCDTDEYREAEIAIAKKYGIPYIDLNGDERTPFMLRSTNKNIPDAVKNARTRAMAIDPDGTSGSVNTHPNKDAHEFQADFIETWLRSI